MNWLAGWFLRLRLLRAGWRARRDVWDELRLPTGLEVFPEARRILTQYGGLRFSSEPFVVVILNPCLDQDEVSLIRDACRLLNKRLYPVGHQEVQDRLYLLVDETGWIYTLEGVVGPDDQGNWVVEASVRIQASSFERALPYLARGEVDVAQGEADLRAAGITPRLWTVEE